MPKLKQAERGERKPPAEFSIAEHLRVQQQIELHAYGIWSRHVSDAGDAFNNWLRAEAEVLVEFIGSRMTASEAKAIHPRRI
jgi:hypothetical protein